MAMKIKEDLKKIFTSYWHFLTLHAACQLNLFDIIASGQFSVSELTSKLNADEIVFQKLIAALIQLDTIMLENKKVVLEKQGILLTEDHPESLKRACLLWGKEHLTAWQNLSYTINTWQPVFDFLYHQPFFDYLADKSDKLKNYHLAMRDYAKDDYKRISDCYDFSKHKSIADIGGGLGTVIEFIADANPESECWLFDLPEVVLLIQNPEQKNFKIVGGSFFKPIELRTDAIVLSRILHDWDDENCLKILTNCRNALVKNGTLYIIEIMQNEAQAYLLSLNMMLMCQSYERTYTEYEKLLQQAGFKVSELKTLNSLQKIMVTTKNEI